MPRVFPPATARISNRSVPLQAAECCRNLFPQQPTMAELLPELLQDGDKDMRGALRGGAGCTHKISIARPLFPCCLPVSVNTCHSRTCLPQLCSHLPLQGCHLSLPHPKFCMSDSTFLHSGAPAPSPCSRLRPFARGKFSLPMCAWDLCPPLAAFICFLVFLSVALMSHLP